MVGHSLPSLVLIATLALLVPLLLRRLRMHLVPIAVGEILIGVIIGRSGLGLIASDDMLQMFTFLGLSCLMFLTGMEINVGELLSTTKRPDAGKAQHAVPLRKAPPIVAEASIFIMTMVAVAAWAWGLHLYGLVAEPLFLTMVMATCGITIIMPVLKDRRMLSTEYGRLILHAGIIGDIIPVVALSVLVSIRVHGNAAQSLWMLLLLVVMALIYYAVRRLRLADLTAGLADGTAQLGVRATIALMLVFVVLAESVGSEAILGAFLAGILGRALGGSSLHALTSKLEALSFGFFIPVFFLMVGVEFDLALLLGSPTALILSLAILVGTVLAKVAAAMLMRLWYPWRETMAGAFLLTTQMSVTVAASTVALSAGAYDRSVHTAVVLVAMVLAVLGPLLFNFVLPKKAEPTPRPRIIVAGPGSVVPLLARRLTLQGIPVSVLEPKVRRNPLLGSPGIKRVDAKPDETAGLAEAGAQDTQVIAAVTDDEVQNLRIARSARDNFGVPKAVVYAWTAAGLKAAQTEGFIAVNPALTEVALVEGLLTKGDLIGPPGSVDGDLQVLELMITGGRLDGQTLRDANLPGGALVTRIRRGLDLILPRGSTHLRSADVATVVVPLSHVEAVTNLFSQDQIPKSQASVLPGHN